MAKQPKSPFLPIKYEPKGGLNSDFSPLAIGGGDYVDAKNIHFLTQLGSTTVAIENCLGNKEVFQLPEIPLQNKEFRIYVQWFSNSDPDVSLEFFNGTNTSLGTATYQPITNLSTTYTAAITAINTLLGSGNIIVGNLITTTTNTGYFTLEFLGGTSVNYWDYSVIQTTAGTTTQPIIISEAVDASLAGFLRFIGSYDLGGDGIIWSTPQTKLPSTLFITSFAAGTGVTIRVRVPDTTDILDGAAVTIQGSNYTAANGTWIVSLVSLTEFDLLGTTYDNTTTAGSGSVTLNVNGVGQIGVAVFDANSSTWNYTSLLTSRELNFRVQRQVKTACERNIFSANIYWTDNYNPYRRFYYQGDYKTDGALNFVDSQNIYFFGEIDLQTRLFQGNGLADIKFYNQLQSGGSLFAGNWRYIIRFLDEFFNPTLWTDPSGIYVVSFNQLTPNIESVAEQVYGNTNTTQTYTTGKINELLLTGIVPNLFKYVELGALQYVDGTTVPIPNIVNRILLAQTPTQVIQHTGNEVNVQSLDINTLLAVQPDIARGLGIDIVSNRLIPSNTRGSNDIDFTDWVQSFQYNLQMSSIPGIGSRDNFGDLKVGEYEVSENTFNNMGFMLNETYRFSAKLELINGAFTQNFWFADVRFDMNINDAPKQTGALPFMDLTSSDSLTVYIPLVNITNVDWDFSVDGIPVNKIVRRIHWEQVEMKEQFREVLASGAIAMGCYTTPDDLPLLFNSTYPCTNFQIDISLSHDTTIRRYVAEYPFIEGAYILIGEDEYVYNGTSRPFTEGLRRERKYMGFYAPDLMFNQAAIPNISAVNGDEIVVFGIPTVRFGELIGQPTSSPGYHYPLVLGAEKEFSGWVDTANFPNIAYPVGQVQNVGYGGNTGFTSLTGNFSKQLDIRGAVGGVPISVVNYPQSPVINTTSDAIPPNDGAGGFTDYAFYIAQYFRPKTNKFGDKINSKYIPTGAITEYLSVDTLMYGDTFNQKTWFQRRRGFTFEGNGANNTCNGESFNLGGFGGGISMYSQNRANSQMISRGDSDYLWKYPSISIQDWINSNDYNFHVGRLLIYNSGYNSQNNVSNDVAFDPNLPNNPNTPARWWWSLEKPEDSVADLYTIILPLNFRDEDLTDGDIWHTIVANQNLFTLQKRALTRQYVNDTTMVSSTESEVVMGSTGVGGQRGSKLSGFGTIHGFGVILGKSQGGKDTFYWIDTFEGKVMRFNPDDGTKCLSDAHNMRWFFNNYTNLTNIDQAMYPAAGSGICGVWDDQRSEAIWTVRTKKQLHEFVPGNTYFADDEVSFTPVTVLDYIITTGVLTDNEPMTFGINGTGFVGHDSGGQISVYNLNITPIVGDNLTGTNSGHSIQISNVIPPVYSTFEKTGELYISKTTNSGKPPDLYPDDWQLVNHFGSDILSNGKHPYQYYNEYTIAYNEVKDKFVTRYSFLPMLYIQIGKNFITPRPVLKLNIAFENATDDSEYGVWYKIGGGIRPVDEQAEGWFIEGMTINYDVNLDKRALSVEFLTEITPERVDMINKKYSTFMLAADFQARGDYFVAAVRNNEVSGVVTGDSSRIFGSYHQFKLSGSARIYQQLWNFICKMVVQNRIWRS